MPEVPLFYGRLDGRPTFDNFVPFGGWIHPVKKLFDGVNICGIDVGKVYSQ